jgi:hypothetical protein
LRFRGPARALLLQEELSPAGSAAGVAGVAGVVGGVGVAMGAGIVLGVVAAREHARRRILRIGAPVEALEVAGGLAVLGIRGTLADEPAGLDQRGGPLRRRAGDQPLARDVRDVVRVLAATAGPRTRS